MIDSTILKLLMKACPNYHLVSRGIANNSDTLCTCGKCVNVISGKHYGTKEKEGAVTHHCSPLYYRLLDDDLPRDYAAVSQYGTCDRARFPKEDYTNFHLEGEGGNP